MFRNKKEKQIRDLQIDSFLGSLFRTVLGGHPPRNRRTAAYETRRRKLEARLKAEAALEPRRKK
jgi:hypothetical protein